MFSGDSTAVDLAQELAHARAYELIELVQARPETDEVDAALAEAERRGWLDVSMLLHYARYLQAGVQGEDSRPELERMFGLAEASGDTVLQALALGSRAERRPGPSRSVDADASDADLARAVAMLEEGRGSLVDRPNAYVACATAYSDRGLWELEEQMYVRASVDLGSELPPPLDGTQASLRRVVEVNRQETLLTWSCALFELGQRDAAADQALRGLAVGAEKVPGLPPEWQALMAAVNYVLAAIAGLPNLESPEQMQARADRAPWNEYRGCPKLAEAIRAHDAGDLDASAALAAAAVPHFVDGILPSARMLAVRLAAERPGLDPWTLAYAREQVELRWEARLRMLGTARAQIEVARMSLEHERLTRRAYVDQLTGLANRHAYDRHLERLRRLDDDRLIAVLMVDVDRFKSVNDTHGHVVGDQVLRAIGEVLSDASRSVDLVARVGGDEFLVVLDGIAETGAEIRGRHLARRVTDNDWESLARGLAVTVSIGVAGGPATEIDRILERADHTLYEIKRTGRGSVAVHPG